MDRGRASPESWAAWCDSDNDPTIRPGRRLARRPAPSDSEPPGVVLGRAPSPGPGPERRRPGARAQARGGVGGMTRRRLESPSLAQRIHTPRRRACRQAPVSLSGGHAGRSVGSDSPLAARKSPSQLIQEAASAPAFLRARSRRGALGHGAFRRARSRRGALGHGAARSVTARFDALGHGAARSVTARFDALGHGAKGRRSVGADSLLAGVRRVLRTRTARAASQAGRCAPDAPGPGRPLQDASESSSESWVPALRQGIRVLPGPASAVRIVSVPRSLRVRLPLRLGLSVH